MVCSESTSVHEFANLPAEKQLDIIRRYDECDGGDYTESEWGKDKVEGVKER